MTGVFDPAADPVRVFGDALPAGVRRALTFDYRLLAAIRVIAARESIADYAARTFRDLARGRRRSNAEIARIVLFRLQRDAGLDQEDDD